jgi:hypothetical protein
MLIIEKFHELYPKENILNTISDDCSDAWKLTNEIISCKRGKDDIECLKCWMKEYKEK